MVLVVSRLQSEGRDRPHRSLIRKVCVGEGSGLQEHMPTTLTTHIPQLRKVYEEGVPTADSSQSSGMLLCCQVLSLNFTGIANCFPECSVMMVVRNAWEFYLN